MSRAVLIDDEVMREVEQAAAAHSTTVDEFIAAALRKALPLRIVEHPLTGFPMFDVPANARPITLEAVQRALDEDDE